MKRIVALVILLSVVASFARAQTTVVGIPGTPQQPGTTPGYNGGTPTLPRLPCLRPDRDSCCRPSQCCNDRSGSAITIVIRNSGGPAPQTYTAIVLTCGNTVVREIKDTPPIPAGGIARLVVCCPKCGDNAMLVDVTANVGFPLTQSGPAIPRIREGCDETTPVKKHNHAQWKCPH